MKQITFEASAFQEFLDWSEQDKQTHQRIVALIKEIVRQPFSGIGKPKPLKHQLKGYWSRRINKEDRLVYKVTENAIIIISCKYHYAE